MLFLKHVCLSVHVLLTFLCHSAPNTCVSSVFHSPIAYFYLSLFCHVFFQLLIVASASSRFTILRLASVNSHMFVIPDIRTLRHKHAFEKRIYS